MAAYRGADSFRAPTDQVYGPYASLHLSAFGESSGFDRFVLSLHWKYCLQLIRLTFPGHRKDHLPPATSLNQAGVDVSRPRRLFSSRFTKTGFADRRSYIHHGFNDRKSKQPR